MHDIFEQDVRNDIALDMLKILVNNATKGCEIDFDFESLVFNAFEIADLYVIKMGDK